MKQGRTQAIVFSLLAHIVLITTLIKLAPETPKAPQESFQINSYLYTPPKASAPIAVIPSVVVKNSVASPLSQSEPKTPVKPPARQEKSIKEPSLNIAKQASNTENNTQTKQVLTSTNNSTSKVNINVLKQLEQIRTSIDENIVAEEFARQNQHHSLSAMHPNPASAPRSVVPLTRDAKKAQNTTRYSDSLAITKTDSGICVIQEDLSNVGIEGVSAVSAFNCGPSKLERAFSHHMKKVTEKLQASPNKN